MKMLDYVQLAHVRMGENLERSSELVAQLVDIFQSGSFSALQHRCFGFVAPCRRLRPRLPARCAADAGVRCDARGLRRF